MAVPSLLNSVSAQIEKVEDVIPKMYEDSAEIASKFKASARVTKISNYLYRHPVKLRASGTYGKVSGHGGVVPAGTSFVLTHFISGYHRSMRVHGLTRDQIDLAASSEQSVINAVSEVLNDMVNEAQADDDTDLHTNGNGRLTNAASTGTATTLTFAAAGDDVGVNRLRPGMMVDVWDNDADVLRAGGPYEIASIDYTARKVTFGSAPTAMATTDSIAIHNLTAYGPAALTTESSTWPARGTASGLGGDSWRHGFHYPNSSTGYFGQIERAAVPAIVPPNVNANEAAIEFSFGDRIIDELTSRFTQQDMNLFGIVNHNQTRAIRDLTVERTVRYISSSEDMGKAADLSTDDRGYLDTIQYCGITLYKSKRQDFDRIDFIDANEIGRAEVFPLRPFRDTPDGDLAWPQRDATTARLKLAVEWAMEASFDYVYFAPFRGGWISNLQVPAGSI